MAPFVASVSAPGRKSVKQRWKERKKERKRFDAASEPTLPFPSTRDRILNIYSTVTVKTMNKYCRKVYFATPWNKR